jgi:hypothetical protein
MLMKRAAKFGPRYGMKRFVEGGSADVEADLQALKTMQQDGYDVGGPRQRGTPRRGRNQGTLDRYRREMAKEPALAPTLEEFMSRFGKKTLSDKDKELDVLATAARRQMAEKSKRGYKKGGSVSSASKRADGCAVKGKTRGKFV